LCTSVRDDHLAKVDKLRLLAHLGHSQDGHFVMSYVFHVHVKLGRLCERDGEARWQAYWLSREVGWGEYHLQKDGSYALSR
jgi:hypothetical protein